MKMRLALLTLSLMAPTVFSFAQTSPDLIVSYPEGNGLADIVGEELGTAYGALGLHIILKPLPAMRALSAANEGETDAEAARTTEIESGHPQLRRVPQAIAELDFSAITTGAALPAGGWDTLKSRHPCVTLGARLIEERTKGAHRELARTLESAVRMLRAGRCEALVIYDYQWVDIDKMHLGPLCAATGVIERVPLYHYVNRRHEDLVPRLTEALRRLREDGTTERLMEPLRRRVDEAKGRAACAARPSLKDAGRR